MKTDLQHLDVNDLNNRYNDIDSSDCSYDAAGNMTVDHNGYQYTYDYENRIIEIQDYEDTTVAEYTYDALGRRIKKDDGQATYYYYNDQWQVLMEYGSDGAWDAYNIYGNYIDETLYRCVIGVGSYVYAHDHLYSTVAAVNFDSVNATDIVERYEYDAYGNVHVLEADFSDDADGISDIDNPYTFTGRRLDVLDGGDLNIMYYRNRYYHPELGRFMTHDPFGIMPDDYAENPFTPDNYYVDGVNVYEYVASRVLNTIDPYGLVVLIVPRDIVEPAIPKRPKLPPSPPKHHDPCGGKKGTKAYYVCLGKCMGVPIATETVAITTEIILEECGKLVAKKVVAYIAWPIFIGETVHCTIECSACL